jgi:hypothetical protein
MQHPHPAAARQQQPAQRTGNPIAKTTHKPRRLSGESIRRETKKYAATSFTQVAVHRVELLRPERCRPGGIAPNARQRPIQAALISRPHLRVGSCMNLGRPPGNISNLVLQHPALPERRKLSEQRGFLGFGSNRTTADNEEENGSEFHHAHDGCNIAVRKSAIKSESFLNTQTANRPFLRFKFSFTP